MLRQRALEVVMRDKRQKKNVKKENRGKLRTGMERKQRGKEQRVRQEGKLTLRRLNSEFMPRRD